MKRLAVEETKAATDRMRVEQSTAAMNRLLEQSLKTAEKYEKLFDVFLSSRAQL